MIVFKNIIQHYTSNLQKLKFYNSTNAFLALRSMRARTRLRIAWHRCLRVVAGRKSSAARPTPLSLSLSLSLSSRQPSPPPPPDLRAASLSVYAIITQRRRFCRQRRRCRVATKSNVARALYLPAGKQPGAFAARVLCVAARRIVCTCH